MAWVSSDNVSPAWSSGDSGTVPLGPGASPAILYRGEGETPEDRRAPSLSGDAVFSGDFMHYPNSRTISCRSLVNISNSDTDLQNDYDGENAAANAKSGLRKRAIPFWDIAERIKLRATPTQELVPRRTETARSFSVSPPSGSTFSTQSSPYLTGDSGRVLVATNPNAGYFNLANQNDCVSGAMTDNAGPSTDLAAEHLVEQNLIAFAWQFMLTGTAPASTRADSYETVFYTVPEFLMDANSVFRRPWSMWDGTAPLGTHENDMLSPEREMWDAIGSVAHPEYMVNLQQTLNAFKSRMMRGIAGISDARWGNLNWDDTSEATGFIHFTEALSEIRSFLAVINYLNHPTAHAPFVASLNRINDIMNEFDAAVARNQLNGAVRTYAGTLWREFTYNVIIRRTEQAYGQYRALLWRMSMNWTDERERSRFTASAARREQIDDALQQLSELLDYDPVRDVDGAFHIDTTGLFADPTD